MVGRKEKTEGHPRERAQMWEGTGECGKPGKKHEKNNVSSVWKTTGSLTQEKPGAGGKDQIIYDLVSFGKKFTP